MQRLQIPNRLWLYRSKMELKQSDVASKLELKGTALISRWENGSAMPTGEQLLRLSVIYRTIPSELYFERIKEIEKELLSDLISKDRHGP